MRPYARDELCENEDVLLNLTTFLLGTENNQPSGGEFEKEQSAFIKVHLISRNGFSAVDTQRTLQPRHITFFDQDSFPRVVDTLSVFQSTYGSIQTHQTWIPLSSDPSIDRIHVERYSGSAILVEASLFRTKSCEE